MSAHPGHCLCGAVAYTGKGAFIMQVCHCSGCRRWTGSPAMTLTFDQGIDIRTPESVRWHRSSDWAERGSCALCGSALFYRLVESDYINVSAGSLDDQNAIKQIDEHVFIEEKPGHYDFAGDAPRVTGAEVAARFQTPGEPS
jgi:hypothetical protein